MDPDDETRMMGRRLRRIRQDRKLSLGVVAGQAGMSESQLSRIERGQRAINMTQVIALAQALRISPSEITRLSVPAPGNGDTDSYVEALRHALAAVDQGVPGGLVVPFEILYERVQALGQARRNCRFKDVGATLPGLIRDIHTSINTGSDLARLLPLAVTLHVMLTYMWLRDAAAPVDLRRDVANTARDLAREHGDETVLCMATFGVAKSLVESGMIDLAQSVLTSQPMPSATPPRMLALGTLLLKSADVAALAQRRADVEASMEAAADLAAHISEERAQGAARDPVNFGFSSTTVSVREMSLALEADEPERALAASANVQPDHLPFETSRAGFWIVQGRALSRLPSRRDDAVRALRTAESLFPYRVYRNQFARDAIGELLHRARQDSISEELRGLAHRAGL